MRKILLIPLLLISCSKSQKSYSIDKVLSQTANELNKNLPMMIDQYTRLDATAPIPGKQFMYSFTIIGLLKDDLSDSDWYAGREEIETRVKNTWKSDDDMQIFRENYIKVIYKYFDENGVFLFDFSFNAGTL